MPSYRKLIFLLATAYGAEADLLTNQVLDELGVQLGADMANAPTTKMPVKESVKEEESLEEIMPDLESRLRAL